MRSSPRFLLGMAVAFVFAGLLNAFNASRTGSVVDACLAGLWFVGAAIWIVQYKAERRWGEGR